MNTILMGLKHSGKTSVGKYIAEKTHRLFIDTDRLIEKYYNKEKNTELTVREIYQLEGESYFRNLEKYMITTLDNIDNSIIATGGGAVLDNKNVSRLKKHGKFIYLYLSWDAWLIRLQSYEAPAFKNAENSFFTLYRQREAIYKHAADVEISVENKPISLIAEEVIEYTLRH